MGLGSFQFLYMKDWNQVIENSLRLRVWRRWGMCVFPGEAQEMWQLVSLKQDLEEMGIFGVKCSMPYDATTPPPCLQTHQ